MTAEERKTRRPARQDIDRFTVFGIAAIVVAFALAAVVSSVIGFANSVCNELIDDFDGARRAVRSQYPLVLLVTGLVPALVTIEAKRRSRRTWPWLIVVGAWGAGALATALTAEPERFCVF